MSNTMQAGSIATLSISWVDQYGNPAPVDGATKWQSSDESVLTVEVASGNPLIANVYSQGPIGPAQIQATADADMGAGKQSITATCDISVIAGQASGGEIGFNQSPNQNPGGPNRPGAGGGGRGSTQSSDPSTGVPPASGSGWRGSGGSSQSGAPPKKS